MFSRQKKNYRTFVYSALVVTLCILIAALLWPKEAPKDDFAVNAETKTQQENTNKTDNTKEKQNNKQQVDTPSPNQNEKDNINQQQESYYIVRKDGEDISVFFIDSDGREVKLETTNILYQLLPPDDQSAFDTGIKASSQEELAAILQDFES